MTTKNKLWSKSKTIQGAIVSLLGLLITVFDLPVGGDEVQLIIGQFAALIGSVYAIYGRIVTDGSKIIK